MDIHSGQMKAFKVGTLLRISGAEVARVEGERLRVLDSARSAKNSEMTPRVVTTPIYYYEFRTSS